ncbi:uncharacterized protein UBRO_20493 [Ustilago bromivora]|uniref:Cytochrome c oxidase assembly protein COX20, mitochondrial n=1 Tax=Ustilago bromivora TaxID=307758 RepID=A0A1K0GJY4_9BASI|nr:uncharacterized protein UBRO_20493 [Ustilago bromivora]
MSKLHEKTQQAGLGDGSESNGGVGGTNAEATKLRAAIASIDPVKDFCRIPNMPCARGSLLTGMATAAGVTGISLVAGRGLRRGLNWGVGSFCFVAIASWEICRRNRKAELNRMRTVIESYKGKSENRANRPSLTSMVANQEQTAQGSI